MGNVFEDAVFQMVAILSMADELIFLALVEPLDFSDHFKNRCLIKKKVFVIKWLCYWNNSHFANDIFKWIFVNENVSIAIKASLIFPKGPINNKLPLVQIMAWQQAGSKTNDCLAYWRDGVSNHRRLDCPWPLWGESTCDRWIPFTKGQ